MSASGAFFWGMHISVRPAWRGLRRSAMTGGLVFWLLVAVVPFWSLGAYNRLVRLRAQVISVFASVDQRMAQALVLLSEAATWPDLPSSRDDAAAMGTTVALGIAGLQAAGIQLEVALRVARKQPLDAGAVAALRTAYATVQDVWSRRPHATAQAASPEEAVMHRAWESRNLAVSEVAAHFNSAVQAYNDAISQFPASILAYLFGFSPAARV